MALGDCRICGGCKCNNSCLCDAKAILKWKQENNQDTHLQEIEVKKIEIDGKIFNGMPFLEAAKLYKEKTGAMYLTIADKNFLLSNI